MRIRKAAIICLIRLLEEKLIEPEKVHENFRQMLDNMKACLDEDYAHDLRFASVVALRHVLDLIGPLMDDEDFRQLYTELIKRLDDAQDGIRIETCKVFEVFFDTISPKWSTGLFEYTLKAVFVHLDDQNPKIQEAVTNVLKKASRVQTQDFIRMAGELGDKSAHPALCKSIRQYAMERFSSKADADGAIIE